MPKHQKKERKEGEPLDNPNRELFCQLYATNREFFGNGVQAYGEAYNIDLSDMRKYRAAQKSAYDLLINPVILERIDELMELGPMNETTVDRQLAFLIEQNADLPSKRGAISEFNKVKGRIQSKLDITTKGKPIGNWVDVLGTEGEEGEDDDQPQSDQ